MNFRVTFFDEGNCDIYQTEITGVDSFVEAIDEAYALAENEALNFDPSEVFKVECEVQ